MRKALLLAGLVGVVLLVRSQRKDLFRFLKIKQMSLGTEDPENVPAAGSQQYPAAGLVMADGSGDCDSALQGGHAAF